MCAACGVPTHVAVPGPGGTGANGMRIGSGLTVGLLGAAIGLRPALGWSSAALCASVAALGIYLAATARKTPAPEAVQLQAADTAP